MSRMEWSRRAEQHLSRCNTTDCRNLIRIWSDSKSGITAKMPLEECHRILRDEWASDSRARTLFQNLTSTEMAVLEIVAMHGGVMTQDLLDYEIRIRRIFVARLHSYSRPEDPSLSLVEKLLLIPNSRRAYSDREFQFIRERDDRDDDDAHADGLIGHPGLMQLVKPGLPLKWKKSTIDQVLVSAPTSVAPTSVAPTSGRPPAQIAQRAPAEVILDLLLVHQWFIDQEKVITNRGGELSVARRKKLAVALGHSSSRSLPLPDPESLYSELLLRLKWLHHDKAGDVISESKDFDADAWLCRGDEEWVGKILEAWTGIRLWQDGIGAVTGLENRYDAHGIDFFRLDRAREILVIILKRMALSDDSGWYELNEFLADVYAEDKGVGIDFYVHGFVWKPAPLSAAEIEKLRGERQAEVDWQQNEGIWIANAVLVTLVELGVTEQARLERAGGGKTLWVFRLTESARAGLRGGVAVGGKIAAGGKAGASRNKKPFLIVQPNREIVVYLRDASVSDLGLLVQLADAKGAGGDPVRTFHLSKIKVCRYLKMNRPEAIIEYFSRVGRTPLPQIVAQELLIWAERFESLVVRKNVTMEVFAKPRKKSDESDDALEGDTWINNFTMFSSAKDVRMGDTSRFVDHHKPGKPSGICDAEGRCSGELDWLSLCRLRRIGVEDADGTIHLTAGSVRQALAAHIPLKRIQLWCDEIFGDQMDSTFKMMIGAWAERPSPVVGEHRILVRIANRTIFHALSRHSRLCQMLTATSSDGWLVVDESRWPDVERVLDELGFSSVRARVKPASTIP